MRKTKIICTIGPASQNDETLSKMIDAGMNVARLNFSHGTHEEHQKKIDLVKRVRKAKNEPIAIMLDTKGPEYRIGTFDKESYELVEGETFTFTPDNIVGDNTKVSVSYKNLAKEMNVGDTILVNNGLLVFTISEIKGNDIICKIINGGTISDRKSMSFPGKVLKQVYLSEQDKSDILFGIKNDVDFIACSFVSNKQDIMDVVNFLHENNCYNIGLIAKIENRSGIDNIEEICSACDGIMIGRGDMGVEIPYEELPSIQKKLITKCRLMGKRVITATEMLESMIHNPRPTRAEISDVANAVYDGTSAIMLSGETAVGKFPVQTIEAMSKIAETTENNIHYHKRYIITEFQIKNEMDAISHAVCGMAMDIEAKAIVVGSISGMTARMISRFRPPVDIIGLCENEKICNQLALSWGIIPVNCKFDELMEVRFYKAKDIAKEKLGLASGDRLIITGGTSEQSGKTNTIRVESI